MCLPPVLIRVEHWHGIEDTRHEMGEEYVGDEDDNHSPLVLPVDINADHVFESV